MGNSAYSYVDECVTQNVRSTSDYERIVRSGMLPVATGHRLTSREQMIRYCVLRFKQLRIIRADFRRLFGFDVFEVIGPELERLAELRLLTIDDQQVALTERGIVYVDDACREIYTPEVRERLAAIEDVAASELMKSLV